MTSQSWAGEGHNPIVSLTAPQFLRGGKFHLESFKPIENFNAKCEDVSK